VFFYNPKCCSWITKDLYQNSSAFSRVKQKSKSKENHRCILFSQPSWHLLTKYAGKYEQGKLFICLFTNRTRWYGVEVPSILHFFCVEEMLHTKNIYSKSFCILTHDFICKYEQCKESRGKTGCWDENLWEITKFMAFLVEKNGGGGFPRYLGKLRAELARSWCCLSCFPRSFSARSRSFSLVFHLLFLFAKVIQFFECISVCVCVCTFWHVTINCCLLSPTVFVFVVRCSLSCKKAKRKVCHKCHS